jgi:hypothetical protein
VKTIYADFQNADIEGFVRLNCEGTLVALAPEGISLAAGQEFVLTDGELRTNAVVVEPGEEGIWRARVDWSALIESTDD